MSEQNKAVARKFYEEIFNKKNVSAVDELISQNFVDHSPMPGQAAGVQGMRDMLAMFVAAFPDLRVNIEEMISENDYRSHTIHSYGDSHRRINGSRAHGQESYFQRHRYAQV